MPTKKKPKAEKITVDKQVVTDLASCVLWALKFLKTPNGGGLWMDMRTLKGKAWEEKFMDALDGVGHYTDRKAFWKAREPKKPSSRKKLEERRRA